MTDDTTEPASDPTEKYDFDTDPDGVSRDDFRDTDPLLDFIRGTLGEVDTDTGVGMTLTIAGAVISGVAVPLPYWSRLLTQQVRAVHEGFADGIKAATDVMVEGRAEIVKRREQDDRPTPDPRYLNLKDVVIVTGSNLQKLGTMRVRASSIDGWSLSQITSSS